MYNDQLEEKRLPIENIFLDPNNPRFWSEQTRSTSIVADNRVPDTEIQLNTLNRMLEPRYGIQELRNSILRNGFLPMDRIVVRELEGCENQFVVIEGNRRLASLISLRKQISEQGGVSEENITDEQIAELMERTNEIDCLEYKGDQTEDIAWILQGIRHIGGIKSGKGE